MKFELRKLNFPTSIYYWAKFFGLAPFTLKSNGFYPATIPGKVYPIAFAGAYLFLSITAVVQITKYNADLLLHLAKTKILYFSNKFFGFGASSLIPILLLSNGKKIVHVLNEMRVASNELKSFGIVENHEKWLKNIFATTVTINTIVATISFIAAYIWTDELLIYPISLTIRNLINVNTVLIFSQVLLCIRQRFALLNEKLYDSRDPVHQDELPRDFRTSALSVESNNQAGSEGLGLLQRVEKIGELHLKFRDLVDQITQIFSGPILLCIFQIALTLTVTSYVLFCEILELSHVDDEEHFTFVMKILSFRVFILAEAAITQFVIAHICATTCQQGNATRVVLFKVWNKCQITEVNNELDMFSYQLLDTPVATSAFGFFDLGYPCLCKVFGTAVTYFIVSVQFNESIRNSET